jgi:hypothetical protein
LLAQQDGWPAAGFALPEASAQLVDDSPEVRDGFAPRADDSVVPVACFAPLEGGSVAVLDGSRLVADFAELAPVYFARRAQGGFAEPAPVGSVQAQGDSALLEQAGFAVAAEPADFVRQAAQDDSAAPEQPVQDDWPGPLAEREDGLPGADSPAVDPDDFRLLPALPVESDAPARPAMDDRSSA